MLTTYAIIALSFALSSMFFIHKQSITDLGFTDYSIVYDVVYIVLTFLLFPLIFLAWLFYSKNFKTSYGKAITKDMK